MVASKKPAPKYRNAEDGKYVPPSYAKTHPKTTVKETGPHPKKVKKS
ncbi:MAG: hypothetical protein JWP06_644 [Candidatus Saccharibacteria bacterium]|nr:hypothetical protein [Candidatus Saccharibacteria bacterium]